jgi:two-component system, sensor histidine kinase and response regulator
MEHLESGNDLESLQSLIQSLGEVAVMELINVFSLHSEMQLGILGEAMAQGDREKIRFESHSLKSSAAALGATGLANLCEQIEKSGKLSPETLARMTELRNDFLVKVQVSIHPRN